MPLIHFGPLLVGALGGAAVATTLRGRGRELLVAGAVGAMRLNQQLQSLAEEARLSLDDIAAEARDRAGVEPPADAIGPKPKGGGAER